MHKSARGAHTCQRCTRVSEVHKRVRGARTCQRCTRVSEVHALSRVQTRTRVKGAHACQGCTRVSEVHTCVKGAHACERCTRVSELHTRARDAHTGVLGHSWAFWEALGRSGNLAAREPSGTPLDVLGRSPAPTTHQCASHDQLQNLIVLRRVQVSIYA